MSPPISPSPPPGTTPEPAAQQVFAGIYRDAVWGRNAQGAGHSGPGSTLHATLLYRTFLQQFLKDNAIRSVVDAGCGDWEFSQALDWSGIDYKGYDIVESAIAADKQKFAMPNIQFFAGNFLELELPPADLLLCKHVLQHLPTRDVQKFLTQASKYKHLLLTNTVNSNTLSASNIDIAVGECRALDPTAPPINLRGVKLLTYWDGTCMNQVVHMAGRTIPNSPAMPFASAQSFTTKSFTEAEARTRIAARGIVNLTGLNKTDQGIWIGKGWKDGRAVEVVVGLQGDVFFRYSS